jgi:uncharacterized membrane protein
VRTRAEIEVPGRISDAEALWYDMTRWPTFIDGFHHVAGDRGGWPAEGSLSWDSVPGGRGRVLETVERYEPRVGQTAQIEDERITGHQTIAFEARPDERVRVTLELRYDLKSRPFGPLMSVVDFLFIRPRQREALVRTLVRFSRELESDRRDTAGQ